MICNDLPAQFCQYGPKINGHYNWLPHAYSCTFTKIAIYYKRKTSKSTSPVVIVYNQLKDPCLHGHAYPKCSMHPAVSSRSCYANFHSLLAGKINLSCSLAGEVQVPLLTHCHLWDILQLGYYSFPQVRFVTFKNIQIEWHVYTLSRHNLWCCRTQLICPIVPTIQGSGWYSDNILTAHIHSDSWCNNWMVQIVLKIKSGTTLQTGWCNISTCMWKYRMAMTWQLLW